MSEHFKHLYSSDRELNARDSFVRHFHECPIPERELLANLGLFLNRQTLSRILFMHDLYRQVIDVTGVVMEFGVRWGQNLSLFSSFRGMYEPYNFNRKIIGFDTFAGFPSIAPQDGKAEPVREGGFSVTADYASYLQTVLEYQQTESPLQHISKFELCPGDAVKTVPDYIERHPETIVALAYFDFDLYEPTKVALEAIKDRLTRGSVIGFDELNCADWPGETRAVMEVLGLGRYQLKRSPHVPSAAYLVID